jgi:hypothetical protein
MCETIRPSVRMNFDSRGRSPHVHQIAAHCQTEDRRSLPRFPFSACSVRRVGFPLRSYYAAMWGKPDDLRLSVLMGLRRGLSLRHGRALMDDEQ